MVCISCVVVPVVLYIWHRFLQPLLLKFWNPWGAVEAKNGAPASSAEPLKCPISGKVTSNDQPEPNGVCPATAAEPSESDHLKGD